MLGLLAEKTSRAAAFRTAAFRTDCSRCSRVVESLCENDEAIMLINDAVSVYGFLFVVA